MISVLFFYLFYGDIIYAPINRDCDQVSRSFKS